MEGPSRRIDRKKVCLGVVIVCVAVVMMLVGEKNPSLIFQVLWILLLGVGLLFYLWGRFFSREDP